MNWFEQAESMMKSWDQTQKKLVGSWYELANNGMNFPGVSGMSTNPLDWIKQGMSMAMRGGAPGQSMAGNLISSQAMMMQSLDMLTSAWKAVSPNLAEGRPWQTDFDNYLKAWSDRLLNVPQQVTSTGADGGGLMGVLSGNWNTLPNPWLAPFQGMGQGLGMGQGFGQGLGIGGAAADLLPGAEIFTRLLRSGLEPSAFQGLSQVPMVGVAREQIAKITKAADAQGAMLKAMRQYQSAIVSTIGQALKKTMAKLVTLSNEGKQISSVRELMRLWIKMVDGEFTRMYVTEEFSTLQSRMSEASLEYKLAQRALVEMISKQFDLPTRTELDDAYKTLYGLKKEIRKLRDEGAQSATREKRLSNDLAKAKSEVKRLREASEESEAGIEVLQDDLKRMSEETAAEIKGLRDSQKKMETKLMVLSAAQAVNEQQARQALAARKAMASPTVNKETAEKVDAPVPASREGATERSDGPVDAALPRSISDAPSPGPSKVAVGPTPGEAPSPEPEK